MKYLAALLLLIRRLLDRWDAIEKEARDEAAQEGRRKIDADSAQYMADRYGDGRVQPLPKYHDVHQADRSDRP